MSAQQSATILYVDDSQRDGAVLVQALRGEGFEVKEASTGSDALAAATTTPPDLVILDVHLPDMSGFEVCRRIKTNPAFASVLVLHLSGHLVRNEEAAGSAPGDRPVVLGSADAYLIKPVEAGELVTQVKTLLRLRQAEEALRASEARLRDILDHAPVVVHVKDVAGRYLLVNRRWEAVFHLGRDEVLGKTAHDIYPRERADAFRANDLKVLETGTPLEFEELAPHGDGLHTYLSIKFPLLGANRRPYAVCGISADVTERKRAEQALRDSEALYHTLVENLPACIILKDRKGRFTFANRPFCQELRKSRDEIVGHTDLDFYPAELALKYMRDDSRVMDTGQVLEAVEEHQTIDGVKSYVEVIKAPVLDSCGQVVGVQGIFWDVTARKRAEEKLGRTAAEFRVARRIQQKLFPAAAPHVPGMDIGGASYAFDISGASYPAEAIGGDYYDYIPLSDGALGIAIGDVSGHGIGPALLMAEVRAYLRAFARTQDGVGRILELINRCIVGDIEGDRFITLLLARLNPATRSFAYASAGHPTGYVLDARGVMKLPLRSTSIPLGILPECDFPCSPEVPLDPGDIVVFLTDGIVEARAPDGSIFGTRRVLDLVRVYRQASAREIVDNLYHAVRAFSQDQPQYDDITATVIKVSEEEDQVTR